MVFSEPSKDAFAKIIIDAARKTGETREIRYDREAFRLFIAGDSGQQFNLQNMYGEYASADAAKRQSSMVGKRSTGGRGKGRRRRARRRYLEPGSGR